MKYVIITLSLFLVSCGVNSLNKPQPQKEGTAVISFDKEFSNTILKSTEAFKFGFDLYKKQVSVDSINWSAEDSKVMVTLTTNFNPNDVIFETELYNKGNVNKFGFRILWDLHKRTHIVDQKKSMYFNCWEEILLYNTRKDECLYITKTILVDDFNNVIKEGVYDEDERTIIAPIYGKKTVEIQEINPKAIPGFMFSGGSHYGNYATYDLAQKYGFSKPYLQNLMTNTMIEINNGFNSAGKHVIISGIKWSLK